MMTSMTPVTIAGTIEGTEQCEAGPLHDDDCPVPTIMLVMTMSTTMMVGTVVGVVGCHHQGRVIHHHHHGLPSPWDLAPPVCDSTGYIEGYILAWLQGWRCR